MLKYLVKIGNSKNGIKPLRIFAPKYVEAFLKRVFLGINVVDVPIHSKLDTFLNIMSGLVA